MPVTNPAAYGPSGARTPLPSTGNRPAQRVPAQPPVEPGQAVPQRDPPGTVDPITGDRVNISAAARAVASGTPATPADAPPTYNGPVGRFSRADLQQREIARDPTRNDARVGGVNITA